ncbi:MAG: hypothetical protein IJO91_06175 [Oscillospiraceae bacterium]|nr:hypothetical protein [Oscillospiraceae bacterium]
MNKNKQGFKGIGIGYVSIMMVFAVICLTILAVLSFQAADSSNTLTQRNSQFTHEYYAADIKSKEILMQLDNAALEACDSGFFEDVFPELAEKIGDVSITPLMDGYSAYYSIPLNNRLSLSVSVKFTDDPDGRFEIQDWKTVSADSNNDGLNVWDGEF